MARQSSGREFQRILLRLRTSKAWQTARRTIFFLKPGWTDLRFWEQAAKFTRCFPDLIKEAERGSAFILSVNGKIEAVK